MSRIDVGAFGHETKAPPVEEAKRGGARGTMGSALLSLDARRFLWQRVWDQLLASPHATPEDFASSSLPFPTSTDGGITDVADEGES